MTREMNDELLLVTLFLGFLRLLTSLVPPVASIEFPSPKAGAEPSTTEGVGTSLVEVPRPSSLLMPPSVEYRRLFVPSFVSLSDKAAADGPLYENGGGFTCRLTSDIRVPAVAGCGFVARGFGFTIGASEGCGGGVARFKSSLRTYVPARKHPVSLAQAITPCTTYLRQRETAIRSRSGFPMYCLSQSWAQCPRVPHHRVLTPGSEEEEAGH